MKIFPVTPSCFERVLALNEASVPHVNSLTLSDIEWFASNSAFFQVAQLDDLFAGFLIGLRPGSNYKSLNYRWFCDHYADFAYVDRIAITDTARRRGIAAALYDAFRESQSDVSVMTCEVNVRPSNEGSMRFHERLGFHQVGTRKSDAGNKEVALMEKHL